MSYIIGWIFDSRCTYYVIWFFAISISCSRIGEIFQLSFRGLGSSHIDCALVSFRFLGFDSRNSLFLFHSSGFGYLENSSFLLCLSLMILTLIQSSSSSSSLFESFSTFFNSMENRTKEIQMNGSVGFSEQGQVIHRFTAIVSYLLVWELRRINEIR